jgi:hypothetical protein
LRARPPTRRFIWLPQQKRKRAMRGMAPSLKRNCAKPPIRRIRIYRLDGATPSDLRNAMMKGRCSWSRVFSRAPNIKGTTMSPPGTFSIVRLICIVSLLLFFG